MNRLNYGFDLCLRWYICYNEDIEMSVEHRVDALGDDKSCFGCYKYVIDILGDVFVFFFSVLPLYVELIWNSLHGLI